ncbi:MAG: PAS domain S-box protein, partial [Chloroflexi bacterium]|nr:PAS domain S-box protein [Chloroflexota bacterium]
DYQIGRLTGKSNVPAAYPLLDQQGDVQAILVVGLDTNYLTSLMEGIDLPKGSLVSLLDSKGTVVARSLDADRFVGTNAASLPVVREILAGGKEGTARGEALDGVNRLYGYSRLEGVSEASYLVVGVPEGVALAQANRMIWIRLTTLLGTAGLAMVAAWALMFMVVSPMRRLVSATRQVARGDFEVRSGQAGRQDELGELARAFDDMASGLAQRQAEIDRSGLMLQISEEKYHGLFNSVRDGIILTDLSGRILDCNQTGLDMLGLTEEESRRLNYWDLVPEPWRGLEHSVITEQVMVKGFSEAYEKEQLRKDGHAFPVSCRKLLVKDQDGTPRAIWSIVTDITARKGAEHRLNKAIEDLGRSNSELEQFAYVASHDLQEPLRMINSFIQLIEKRYKGRLDTDADEFIAYVVNGASRMQTMIDDLLTYSRVGTRGQPPEQVNAEKALAEAEQNLKVAIEETMATITHDTLPEVMADPIQMVQLFQNLIGNGIKFHRQGERPRIHVRAQRKDSEWVFAVSDNGIGIPSDSMDRLFQVFQRLQPQGKYPGTGIGLAVCKKIVERHSGRIWVESEVGKGSTFFFSMPVKAGQSGITAGSQAEEDAQ